MKTTTIQIEIPAPPDTHFLLPQEWKGKVKFQEGDLAYDCDRGWKDTRTGVVWHSSGVLAVARLIATPEPAEPQPRFKVGDKVIYVHKSNPSLWTVDSVDIKGIPHYGIKDDSRIDYVCEPDLQATKLVPWTFETRPAGMVWVRGKSEKRSTVLATSWDTNGVYGPKDDQPTSYKDLYETQEWSADGKNNWRPCGNYEPDNS